MDEINSLRVSTLDEAEALRIKYLSKKGEISSLFNDFRNVANEDKREVGQLLNELKNKAQDKLNELKESLKLRKCCRDFFGKLLGYKSI